MDTLHVGIPFARQQVAFIFHFSMDTNMTMLQHMPHQEPAPSLELGAMEFFIMALVANAHLASLHEFQQRAGLQPGGIRPALQRLERAELITRAQASRRKRKALALTPLGSQVFYSSWRECLRDYPDTESMLRARCVALQIGAKRSAAWRPGPERSSATKGGMSRVRVAKPISKGETPT